MGASEPRDDARHARAAARAPGQRPAAIGRRRAHRRWRSAGSSASWAAACSASTSWRCSMPSARRGCCSWRPTCARPRASSTSTQAELLEWVVVHEVTHAVQFTGVPWLREHLARCCASCSASVNVEVDPTALLRMPKLQDLRAAVDSVREDGLVHAVAGPERKAILDRLQATMALIEGHAEHVMDAAGADVLPVLPALREALDRRRREQAAAGQAARAAARPRPQAAPVRGRQALLRRGRRATGASRASTAPGAPPSSCRRSPSSTDPAAWRRAERPVRSVTPGSSAVYKHVFAWYASREQD